MLRSAREAHCLACLAQALELVRVYIPLHGQMVLARLQILAQRQHRYAVAAQILHDLQHFIDGLSQAQHKPRLGRHLRMVVGKPLQQAKRPTVVGPRPHAPVHVRYRFEVVVEDVRGRLAQDVQGAIHPATKIGHQDLHSGERIVCANSADTGDEMTRTAISQVVAVDRCDNHVAQVHGLNR
jgi:hypothetical protein